MKSQWTSNMHKKNCHSCNDIMLTNRTGWVGIYDHTCNPPNYIFLCEKCAKRVLAAIPKVAKNAMFNPCVGKIRGITKL